MKKLATLLLAAGLAASAVSDAPAVEIRASGMFDVAIEGYGGVNGPASFMDSKDYRYNYGVNRPDSSNKHFDAVQRVRLNLDFIMSENLSAHYGLQVGTFTWGGPQWGVTPGENSGGALGARAANLSTREAYIDWMVPRTDVKIRMGQQTCVLPAYAINSPVLDDTATGVTAFAPFNDKVGVTGYWIRALSSSRRGTDGMDPDVSNHHDTFDLFGLNLNLRGNGFELTPWGVYGMMGSSAHGVRGGDSVAMGSLPVNGFDRLVRENGQLTGRSMPSDTSVWFAGIGGEINRWDPFRLALDFYYSGSDNKYRSTERSGWYIAASAEYHTSYGTPALRGWFASGDDSNVTNGSERPLTLSGAFNPGANIYFHGRYSIANTVYNADAGGTWGVSAQWNNATFIENLYHSLRVTYFQGTNSRKVPAQVNWGYLKPDGWAVSPANYLTTEDSVIEVDFDTTYSIYKNLATVLELGYAFQNFDGNVWRGVDDRKADFSNAWRAALNFRYTF